MGLKIDVCSLYLLNISKHHIFTTQYGYLIGAGMKWSQRTQKKFYLNWNWDEGWIPSHNKLLLNNVETSSTRTKSQEVECGLWSGHCTVQPTVHSTVHSTFSGQPLNGSAFCRSGPERVENLTHQNLCLVAAYSHKHCTTQQQHSFRLLF